MSIASPPPETASEAGLAAARAAAGGTVALAGLVGARPQAVSQWEYVPQRYVPLLSYALRLPPRVLRPDLAAMYDLDGPVASPDMRLPGVYPAKRAVRPAKAA